MATATQDNEGTDSPSDTELAERFFEGDKRAFEMLVDRYYGYLWKCCYGVIQNREDAEELVQDTFLRAARKMGRFLQNTENRNFKAWIRKMAINLAITRKRKGLPASSGELNGVQASEESDPVRVVENEEAWQAVWKAARELPEPMRTYFWDRHVRGLSINEIARTYDRPIHHVVHYLNRSREIVWNKLRKLFDDDRPDK